MALRISGGDWTPWADVAHQVVGEQQGQQALDLRAEQMRDSRQDRQQQLYMQQLGLKERGRQFDATHGLREEELGERFFRDGLQAEQKADELVFRMEEAGYKRGLTETNEAIKMGSVFDTAKKQWRPITKEDKFWDAHQEYKKAKRQTINKNIELNRRVRFIDGKIRNNEKMVSDLRMTRSQILGSKQEYVDQRAAIDRKIGTIGKEITRDRGLYNDLYKQFFKGYGDAAPQGGVTPQNEAAAREVEAFGQQSVDPDPDKTKYGYSRFGHARPSAIDEDLDRKLFAQRNEQMRSGWLPQYPVRYRPESQAKDYARSALKWDGPYSDKAMYRLQHPDIVTPASNELSGLHWVKKKAIPQVKRELMRILKANKDTNPAELRMKYFKKHRKLFSNDPRG